MPDPFVYVESLGSDVGTVELDRDADHHLRTVLRLDRGAGLTVSDGHGGHAPAELGAPGRARLTGAVVTEPAPPVSLHAVQALAKGRKVDEVVRALTELGVDRITVVAAARSVVRLGPAKAEKARRRWLAVARAAGAQARRVHLPVVEGPHELDRLHPGQPAPRTGVVADPSAVQPLREALAGAPWDRDEVVFAVGPEGGWTADELGVLTAAGLGRATLGAPVLRTEHAGLALGAILTFTLGRMG